MALRDGHVRSEPHGETCGRRFDLAAAIRLAIRLMPATALFALAFTGDSVLEWLSLLGVLPLALAFLPGVAGGCGACRPAGTSWPSLPPAH